MKLTTKKIATMGMLAALAYVAMVLIHLNLVPAAPFLTYDPKDAVIAVSGFVFGPLSAVIISIVVAFLEMITVSSTGIIGFFMQVIATAAFTLPSSIVYKHGMSKKRACMGLGLGILSMTAVMVLWNYILTPIYMGADRAYVASLLVPAIIPFNLLKGLINSVMVMLIYKPLVKALRKAGFIEER